MFHWLSPIKNSTIRDTVIWIIKILYSLRVSNFFPQVVYKCEDIIKTNIHYEDFSKDPKQGVTSSSTFPQHSTHSTKKTHHVMSWLVICVSFCSIMNSLRMSFLNIFEILSLRVVTVAHIQHAKLVDKEPRSMPGTTVTRITLTRSKIKNTKKSL